MDLAIPNNAGYFRPIEVIAPRGTVVNPRMPAAVAARGITGIRIADAIFGALAQAVPDVLPACGSNAPDVGISFGGVDAHGESHVYLEFLLASWGGGPDRDGMDACTGTLVNYSNAPVEMIEADQPIVVERYAMVADSGGPGTFAAGLRSSAIFASESIEARCRSARTAATIRRTACKAARCGAPSNVDIVRANGNEEACRRQVPHHRRPGRRVAGAPRRRRRARRSVDARSGGGPGRRARGEDDDRARARSVWRRACRQSPLAVDVAETARLRALRAADRASPSA